MRRASMCNAQCVTFGVALVRAHLHCNGFLRVNIDIHGALVSFNSALNQKRLKSPSSNADPHDKFSMTDHIGCGGLKPPVRLQFTTNEPMRKRVSRLRAAASA